MIKPKQTALYAQAFARCNCKDEITSYVLRRSMHNVYVPNNEPKFINEIFRNQQMCSFTIFFSSNYERLEIALNLMEKEILIFYLVDTQCEFL